MGLLSQNFKGADVMLTFWKDGLVVRTLTVDELIPDKKILHRTVSHYMWGSCSGITKGGLLGVILLNNSKLYLEPKTGQQVKEK